MEVKPFLFVLLMGVCANAYIPNSEYIMSRIAKSHGKGLYSFEQEVIFQSESETLAVREFWTIADGETMRLTAKAGTLSLAFIFNDGKAYFSEDNKLLARKLSIESLERFFNVRSEKALSDFLLSTKVLTLNPLRLRPRPRDLKLIKPEVDPYLRLVRIGDDPTILISSTVDPKEPSTAAGIWVDQDNYTIRKIRFPSQTEVQASNYQTLSNDLIAPKIRTVTWGTNTVEIRLVKASSLPKSKAVDEQFATSSLSATPLQWGNSTLLPQIKEFYQRFR